MVVDGADVEGVDVGVTTDVDEVDEGVGSVLGLTGGRCRFWRAVVARSCELAVLVVLLVVAGPGGTGAGASAARATLDGVCGGGSTGLLVSA